MAQAEYGHKLVTIITDYEVLPREHSHHLNNRGEKSSAGPDVDVTNFPLGAGQYLSAAIYI